MVPQRFFWRHKTTTQLQSLVDFGLPRNGDHTTSISLNQNDLDYGDLCLDEIALASKLLSQLPNLTFIDTNCFFAHIVSTSLHFDNLTHLRADTDYPSCYVRSIILHSPNLISLRLRNGGIYDEEEERRFVEAVASSPRLRTLELEYVDFLLDERMTTKWICPLTRLEISHIHTPYTYSQITNFLSHFSSTLLHLKLQAKFASWISPLSPTIAALPPLPLHLPHLDTLQLKGSRAFELRDSDFVKLPMYFRDSPIKTLVLHSQSSPRSDVPSPFEALRPFMCATKETLKTVELELGVHKRTGGQELAAIAEEVGITLVKRSGYMWGDGLDDESEEEPSESEMEDSDDEGREEEEKVGELEPRDGDEDARGVGEVNSE